MKSLIFYGFLFIIILSSFFLFSARFSSLVSSDDAMFILMLHDFDYSNGWYCWNQDRLGSITPLIGQVFLKLFNLSASLSESLARFIILIAGFFSYRTFFKNPISQLALAIVYFLPALYFKGFVSLAWGIMYSLLGIVLYLVKQYKTKSFSRISKAILFSSIWVFVLLSIWAMDQAIVPLTFLGVFLIYHEFKGSKSIYLILKRKEFYFSLIAISLVGLVIFSLKSSAILPEYYQYNSQLFNNLNGIISALNSTIESVQQEISFRTIWPIASVYYWFVLLSFPFSIYLIIRSKNPVMYFSFALFLSLLIMVISSEWVLKNGVSRRYFLGAYFVYGLFFIYSTQQFINRNKALGWSLIVILLMGFSGSVKFHIEQGSPGLSSRYEQLQELEQLGKIGLIANYWYSYGVSFALPDQIVATPHESNEIKKPDYIPKVFNQPRLFLIKEFWFEEFPKITEQFGRRLEKTGGEIVSAGITLQEYKQIDLP